MGTSFIPSGQDYDGTGVEFKTGADGGHGNGLGGFARARAEIAQFIEYIEVRNGNLGLQASLVHHSNSLARVCSLGRLTGQHDTVRSVKDGIGNVGHLGTSRTRVICHGLEHLGGTNDRLALNVTLGDHHLLGDEDLGSRDLDTEVTTGDHDAIRFLENFVEVVDTLLVLNLGNDLDLFALFTEDCADMANVASTANKGREDHLDLVLRAELEITNVLFGEGWKVNVSARQVHTLPGRDLAVIETLDAQGLIIYNLEDLEREDTIVDIDQLAGFDHLGDVLVIDVPVGGRPVSWIGRIWKGFLRELTDYYYHCNWRIGHRW